MTEPYWEPLGAPANLVSYGTTLPTSPYDGQEAILVDSITNPTYQWRFRYNALSTSTYKWEFVGGPPVSKQINSNDNCNSGTLVDIGSTPGPLFTIPRAGDYLFSGSIWINAGIATQFALADVCKNGASTGVWAIASISAGFYSTGSFVNSLIPALAAGDVMKLMYRIQAGPITIGQRILNVLPVRVS